MKNIRHGRVEHFCTGMWNCILNRRWRLLYKLRCSMYPAQNSMLYLDTAMGVVLIFYRETRVQRNRRSVVTVLSNCRNEQGRHDICQFVLLCQIFGPKISWKYISLFCFSKLCLEFCEPLFAFMHCLFGREVSEKNISQFSKAVQSWWSSKKRFNQEMRYTRLWPGQMMYCCCLALRNCGGRGSKGFADPEAFL